MLSKKFHSKFIELLNPPLLELIKHFFATPYLNSKIELWSFVYNDIQSVYLQHWEQKMYIRYISASYSAWCEIQNDGTKNV